MTKRRFFYHFNKHTGGMTVHFKGQCIPVNDVACEVPCETKWNKRQPRLVMQGHAANVHVLSDPAGYRKAVIE